MRLSMNNNNNNNSMGATSHLQWFKQQYTAWSRQCTQWKRKTSVKTTNFDWVVGFMCAQTKSKRTTKNARIFFFLLSLFFCSVRYDTKIEILLVPFILDHLVFFPLRFESMRWRFMLLFKAMLLSGLMHPFLFAITVSAQRHTHTHSKLNGCTMAVTVISWIIENFFMLKWTFDE